jgi:hypothetical protein
MPRSGVLPPIQVETPGGLRDMAERARRFAGLLPCEDDGRRRLLDFAVELETRAGSLETTEIKAPET